MTAPDTPSHPTVPCPWRPRTEAPDGLRSPPLRGKGDDVRAHGIDEVSDGVVGVVELWERRASIRESTTASTLSLSHHSLDVHQLVEQHEFDGDERIVVGADIAHVVVELVGHLAQLGELLVLGDEASWVPDIRAMPDKLV